MKRTVMIAGALLSFQVLGAFNDDLIPNPDFQPVMIDGEITAAKGWYMWDYGRRECLKEPEYLDGRRCLKLKFEKPGTMTIEFSGKENLPEKYFGKRFVLVPFGGAWATNCSEPVVPAPAYRLRYQLKISQGDVLLPDKRRVKASEDFQTIDYTVKSPYATGRSKLQITIRPNLKFSIRQASVKPVYPKIGGFIRLPDGGKLTRIIVSEDADFMLRVGAMVWRGWLWKLTGTALPIDTRKVPAREDGAMVIVRGDSAPGGYLLKIDRNGALLTVRDSRDACTSAFNYIRRHGVRLYSRDTQKIPAPNADLTLAAVNENLVPKYRLLEMNHDSYLNGGGSIHENHAGECDWLDNYKWVEYHQWCNQLVPMEFYRKSHPEYYMLDRNGKRQKTSDPFFLTLCLTHPDVRKMSARRFSQYMQANESYNYAGICMGDRPVACQCPACLKLNGGSDSISNSYMDFLNHLSDSLRKAIPGTEKKVVYCAYHLYRFPPDKIKPDPGIDVQYCAQPRTMPCVVHVDCEINRRALADYRQWSKLVGKEHLGVMFYEESRPYYEGRLLEYFSRYGSRSVVFATYSPAKRFYIAGRFRFGDDPDRAEDEFIDGYYGAGGKYIKQIYRMVDEYCKNYKHTEEDKREFCVAVLSPRTTRWKSVLTREIFDRSYKLFDQALKAAGTDRIAREHILYDKYRFLMADLPKYPRSVCRNEKETRTFGKRLGDFMRTLIELDELKKKNPLDTNLIRLRKNLLNTANEQDFLLTVSGLVIPAPKGKSKWFECKEIQDFLKDPENAFVGKSGVKTIPGGYEWDTMSMFGGDEPIAVTIGGDKRVAKVIRRPHSGKGTISVVLNLKSAPKHACRLILSGLDDDKPGAATFRVAVNGKEVFSGANTFSETAWSVMGIDIPEGVLKAGENRIEIINTMKELPSDRRKLPQTGIDLGDVYETDYFRGWIMLSRIRLLDLSGEFAKLIEGKKSLWQQSVNPNFFNPKAVFEVTKGKLHLATDEKSVRAAVCKSSDARHYVVRSGETLKFSALISGTGTFDLNITCFDADGKYNRKVLHKKFPAPPEEKWISWTAVIPEGTVYVLPGISVLAGGDCRIADCRIETVDPQEMK